MFFDGFYYGEIVLEFRKMGIALVDGVDVANEPYVDAAGECFVNFRSADYKNISVRLWDFFWAVDYLDAGMAPCFVAGKDNVAALRQRPADGLEGFPSHQHGVA